jgi:hypothetical protein
MQKALLPEKDGCSHLSPLRQCALFFAQRASTQPYASMLACVAVPTVAGGGVNFVRDIVDMVPHASRGNGHTATKQDQIPTIWAVGKLESVY